MKISRKEFIRRFSSLGVLIGTGALHSLKANQLLDIQEQVSFRFIIASDSHYGQPDTPFEEMANTFVSKANAFHKKLVCDFCVLNGDIIHDDPKWMPEAKKTFKKLKMPLHVTQGNHDRLTASAWEKIWYRPVNYSFNIKNHKGILVTTSDETGEYLSPDLEWLSKEIEEADSKNVLLFVHIPQEKWTKHAIDTPEFFEVIGKYGNVKAVFHGHEHDQDGIFRKDDIPFIFDSHIGGSWGTDYKGFRVVEVLKDHSIVTYMMDPDVAMKEITL